MQSILSSQPFDKLLVDFYGPLPTGIFQFSYIFVIVDNFTRFVKLYPLQFANAKICVKKLTTDYFPNYGVTKNIVSDHGRQFVSKYWQTSLKKYNIQVSHTSIYHPQSNPAERVMRKLRRMFQTYYYQEHSLWPQYVLYIEWTLNNVRHESTHQTPSALFLQNSQHNPLIQFIHFPDNLSFDHNNN
jgi:transposase InsO family protein